MKAKSHKAFTMIELIYVIVIIGILSAVAIPKFRNTSEVAHLSKAKSVLTSVVSSMATERQKRILRGDFTHIGDLGDSTYAFSYFDNNTSHPVLEYPVRNCTGTERWCWNRDSATQYTFRKGAGGANIVFTLSNSKLECAQSSNCADLE